MSSLGEGGGGKVIILGTAYPYRGGLAAFNERLARALMAAGFEVEIITFTLQYPNFLFPGKSQFSEDDAPLDLKITRRLNAINPISWWLTGRMIRKKRPDILLTKFWIPLMGPALGTVARIVGKKYVTRISILDNVIPHEKRFGDSLMISYFVRSYDGFIAMSKLVQNDLRIFNSVKPCLVNPHPLYDNFGNITEREIALRSLGLSEEYRYLLFFGIIRDYKGLDLILESFADQRLRNRNLRLIVAGEFYSDPAPYHQQITKLNIGSEIIMHTEFIPDSKVADYFNASDIIVQPYKSATQSGVTQIAYHFEKPMIITNVGGLAELVPNGKVGYVVDPDPSKITEALLDFYKNGRYESMRTACAEEKKKYSWINMVNTIKEFMEVIPKAKKKNDIPK